MVERLFVLMGDPEINSIVPLDKILEIIDFQYFITPTLKGENIENQVSVIAEENVENQPPFRDMGKVD